MECAICYKTEDQVELFEGVYNREIIKVCNSCAAYENIPVVRKPSSNQIAKSKETNYSVRDRMERISGMHRITPISNDQSIIQGRMARLRTRPKKQIHPDVTENYDWAVNMGRRRKKLSTLQLSQATGIPRSTIEDIEKGIIPPNFKETFSRLQSFLGERLLREQEHQSKVKFVRKVEVEEDLLDTVRRRMSGHEPQEDIDLDERVVHDKVLGPEERKAEELRRKERKERADSITKGSFDFSDRRKLETVTLSELAEIKKEREKREKERKEEEQRKEMMGDDVDLDE